MQNKNAWFRTTPFDLYELELFRLVARHRSFTKAAGAAGLTQSAITRQVQGVERSLGTALFERTTRSVALTPAGEFLFREASKLSGDAQRAFEELTQQFAQARKTVRVGVSRSIGMGHLPGFFHANLKKRPEVECRVSCDSTAAIVSGLESNERDLGVFCPPKRLPTTLKAAHQFEIGRAHV